MHNDLDVAVQNKIVFPTIKKMHILQSKHTILNEKESEELLTKLNICKAQLPKIFSSDPSLPEGGIVGDIIKIERKEGDETNIYYRVVL